jgi:3-hydroxybutyrate dehydrogenase
MWGSRANVHGMSLSGRTALVTGSTQGIGLAIARTLAAAGANVMLHGLGEPAAIERLSAEIAETHGVRTGWSDLDLTCAREIPTLVERTAGELGALDILVNNAGMQHIASLEEFPPEMWDRLLALNLSAMFHTIRSALPPMKVRGWGRIVNIASVHGLVASPFKVPYIASKHGVIGLTKGVALEVGPHGITCNAIAPGFVETPMFHVQAEGLARVEAAPKEAVVRRQVGEKQAIARLIDAQEIAGLVAFLCSEAARTITGTTIPIDGGWTAQ